MISGEGQTNILVLGLLVVEDLLDPQSHSLTRPHVGDLTEPTIFTCPQSAPQPSSWGDENRTLDGGVNDFGAHFDSARVYRGSVMRLTTPCQL